MSGPYGRRERPPAPRPLAGAGTVDAHTHLDACGCLTAQDVAAAMDRAEAVGVHAAVTVADDLDSARWVVRAAEADRRVLAAVALHPTRADALDEVSRTEIERLVAAPRVVAVGETGLDYYWPGKLDGCAEPGEQRDAFAWHIELAKRVGKPLMVHDREAHQGILDVLRAEGAPDRVIFHCFSGDAELARACSDAGYLMSFAGPVTFRNAGPLREAAALVPAELLLVETDAPFLTPHPHRGRANEPYCLPWTVRGLAAARKESPEAVSEATRANADRVFRLTELATAPS